MMRDKEKFEIDRQEEGFIEEDEKELQSLMTKIKFKYSSIDDHIKADKLTRRKWKSELEQALKSKP